FNKRNKGKAGLDNGHYISETCGLHVSTGNMVSLGNIKNIYAGVSAQPIAGVLTRICAQHKKAAKVCAHCRRQ
ncbi:MAG: hypothetical protein J6A01_12195, partial [Proteobacteria bacterium]|nr:hypothetical protein [Pseudomonadota bacterium]